MGEPGFKGFSKETLNFFKKLKKNNDKNWFGMHREEYDDYVLNPAKAFIIAMGEKLKELSPAVNADPRTNKSLFRINRDIRFSNDKTPYKTHMAVIFWDGPLSRMESSGFHFHLEMDSLNLGVGLYKFTRPQLEEYRNSVVHPEFGKQLVKAYDEVSKKGYKFGGKNYKRIPGDYDPGHENAQFLLYDGMYAGKKYSIPDEFYSEKLLDFCLEPYRDMLPAQRWLSELAQRVQ